MSDKNLVTTANVIQSDAGGDAYPQLSPAQEKALDRDADGKPGGSKAKAAPAAPEAPAAPAPVEAAKSAAGPRAPGQVVRKGVPVEERKATDAALVVVKITKAGDGKVHDGFGGFYAWNDEVVLPREVGAALEGRAFGEICENA